MVPKKLFFQPTGASGSLRGQALEGFLPLCHIQNSTQQQVPGIKPGIFCCVAY